MKTPNFRNIIALLSVGLALKLDFAFAADISASTGTVTGRVQNVVTGLYLNQARVTVQGTSHITFTDSFGHYRLVNLPAGPAVLEVFYTDLDEQRIPIAILPNQTIEQDVGLTSVARYGRDAAVVALDPFLVSTDRETDAQAIAANEQRFASNIKNVVSTESLGDVLGNNVGEFMKMLPGVIAGYSGSEIIGVSVRGFDTAQTTVAADGVAMASAEFAATRNFNMLNTSLNDISRIEVTKVPTPSSPADSMGGTVNLVSKSAFERSKAQLRVGVSLVANSQDVRPFRKSPDIMDDRLINRTQPGLDFDYTLPIGKNFGIVITGMHSRKHNPNDFIFPTWNTGGTATGASLSAPYLQTYRVSKTWRDQRRRTFSFKADWRVTRYSVLTFGLNWNDLATRGGGVNFIPTVGANGNPTPASGTPFSYGPDFVIGATGRAGVTLSANNDIFFAESLTPRVNYRFDDGTWRINAVVSTSKAERGRLPAKHKKKSDFFGMSASLNAPGSRITFSDITPFRPGRIQAFNANNQELDLNDLRNYRLASATDTAQDITTRVDTIVLGIERRLQRLPFPVAVQVGGSQRTQDRDSRGRQDVYAYNGVGGDLSPAPYTFQNWVNQDAGWGFRNIPAYSVSRAFDAWLENPALFTQTAAQIRASEVFRLTNSEYVKETVTAGYLQAEASMLANRLRVLAGVRFEKTVSRGLGSLSDPDAVWVRNPNGTFARDTQGNRIRRPEAGAVNSMEELALTQKERAAYARGTYDNFFPSLHLNYNLRENFIARVAYAKTYARPNFSNIIPRTVTSESDLTDEEFLDPSVVRGRITMRNTALRPWVADNYDLSLEYYTEYGGVFSAGAFLKDISDFFGNAVRLATPADIEELGLDPRYVGWDLVTQFNSGDAKISGVELNVRQSLRILGTWGQPFTVFANATKLRLKGERDADFGNLTPESANWGFTFSKRPITFTARWNYTSERRGAAAPAFGPDAYNYSSSATMLDLNLAWQLTRRFAIHTTFNNVTDTRDIRYAYGSQTPSYARITQAREYGAMLGISLRGTF